MKTYETPTIEIIAVSLELLQGSDGKQVNHNRDAWAPSGGGMTNSAIWDDTDSDSGEGE